eukprot:Amastigsp_a2514_140.p2 type:complete len:156 gc:universal Amastigsp_a2514_140:493-26(-)
MRIGVSALSGIAGVLFAIGWWLWLDGVAYSVHINNNVKINPAYWIPGFTCSFFVLMLLPVSSNAVNASLSFSFDGDSRAQRARIWFLLAFIIGIGSIIAALALLITEYLQRKDERAVKSTWPGVAMFLQSLLVFLSGLVYRFGGDQVHMQYREVL